MKIVPIRTQSSGRRAFTLPEVMIASSLLLLVIGGVLVGNSFGMRMLGIVQPKLLAHEESVRIIRRLSNDISESKFARVGNWDGSSFSGIADGSFKQGNAVQLYGSFDTNEFIQYFHDAGDNMLKRMTNGGSSEVVAAAVSNDQVFAAEDYQGNILTNERPRITISAFLDFYELSGSGTPIGTNSYFTSYALNIKVSSKGR